MLETGEYSLPLSPATTLPVQGPTPPLMREGKQCARSSPALKGSNLKPEGVDPNPYRSLSREGF